MGLRVLRKSERATTGSLTLAGAATAPDAGPARSGVWARWARLVERRPVMAGVLAVAVLAALAAPALTIRLGAADDSSAPTGTSARSYYDTMANAFGKGFDAQVLLVAQTPDSQARTAWTTLTRQLPEVKGVASVGTPAATFTVNAALVPPAGTTTQAGTETPVRLVVRAIPNPVLGAARLIARLQESTPGDDSEVDLQETPAMVVMLVLALVARWKTFEFPL